MNTIRRIGRVKLLAGVAAAGALLAATMALTASNTVPDSNAGAGSGAISGYTVSAVDYNLLPADPTKLTSVTFSLDGNVPASYDTKIQLEATGPWFDCDEGAFTTVTPVTCSFASGSEPTVASSTQLSVVVAQ